MAREQRKVEVATIHRDDWPDSLDGLIQHLDALRQTVPLDHQPGVVVEFDYDSYDGGAGWLVIYYTRPETDEEMAERVERSNAYRRDQENRERYQLAQLKAKYEAKP